jgi:hypothetical protein
MRSTLPSSQLCNFTIWLVFIFNCLTSICKFAFTYFQLLEGCSAEGDLSPCLPVEASDTESQLIVLQSKLLHAEESGKQAKEDLSRVTRDCLQLQASKVIILADWSFLLVNYHRGATCICSLF